MEGRHAMEQRDFRKTAYISIWDRVRGSGHAIHPKVKMLPLTQKC
jgi:hypothetical protein